MINRSTASFVPSDLPDEQAQAALPPMVESPDDLRQRVRLFLEGSNVPGLRQVDVEIDGDTVYLRGWVRTFYEKQLASRLSRHVAGVIHVVDLIEAGGYSPRIDSGRNSRRPLGQNPPRPNDSAAGR